MHGVWALSGALSCGLYCDGAAIAKRGDESNALPPSLVCAPFELEPVIATDMRNRAMNLETRLPKALWEAVRANYEKRNFTGAILDAFYFLSELLRNKSGTEGDGASLIGQALGGAAPKIKLNRLQTESEWNIQKGMEQLLRGFYQSVRNPRSHDKVADSEDDAQTLIIFVGYLIKQIDQAKAQFSRPDFVTRVFDPDFVPKERYAELLVAEIPARARLDIFLDLYRENERWKSIHMRIFLKVFLRSLDEDEIRQICEVISEDLKTSDSESTIRATLGALPPDLWPRVSEAARLRVENKLVRSVREGRYDSVTKRCRGGTLGTWATNIFGVMSLKEEMIDAITAKLRSNSAEERGYVFQYIFRDMKELSQTIPPRIASALRIRLKAGDTDVHENLFFSSPWEKSGWPDDLTKAFSSFQATEPTKNFDDDDIPF